MSPLFGPLKGELQKLRSLIPATARYGAHYRKHLAFLEASQRFSAGQHLTYQLDQLREHLRLAFRHVPYYRGVASGLGITAEDVRSLEDLRILPMLTREMISTRMPELLAANIPASRRRHRYTGGTSGIPLGFYVEAGRTDSLERAFVARVWGWFGVRFEDPAVIIRGYAVDEALLRRDCFWQISYPERRWTHFSSFHMTERNLPAYAREIRRIDPVFISCSASDLDLLARYWLREGLPPLTRLKMIHQSGEMMFPEQRDRFKKAFGARAFSTYGQSECTVLASECEQSSDYHVFPEYGVTEIVRPDGSPARPGELGEIVATGFNNNALPMIRYRTGDLASWSDRTCSCGRQFPLFERLEGRAQQMLVGREGTLVPLNSVLYSVHAQEYAQVRQMQVRQSEKGRITIAVIPYPGFDQEVSRQLGERISRANGGVIEATIELVEDLPRGRSGKPKFLVQALPVHWGGGLAAPPPARIQTESGEDPGPDPAPPNLWRSTRNEIQKLRSLIPANLRYGGLYRRTFARLQVSQYWDEERLRELQVWELRRLLRHAREHVPYYARLLKDVGLNPEDVRGPEDLRALPLLSKEEIQALLPELLAQNFSPSARQERTTGGTTGTPLGFFVERGRTDPLERAFIARFWGWMGVRFEDRSVILKGMVVEDRLLREGVYWQTSYPERHWTFFSAHHISDEHLDSYARKIRELNPDFIQSFPSGLDLLARYWIRKGLPPLPGLKMIHLSSETLRPEQRNRFEKAFGSRVFSNYGQSECAVLASECEHDAAYHVFPEYGVTEILRPDGTPTAPGEIGEVVGTGFNNHVMPLIRYRTGDLAAWSRRRCVCGRAFPLLEQLEGRGQDVVVAMDGHILPLNALIYGSHLPEFRHVKELQVRQRVKGELELGIVPYASFTPEIGEQICRRLERVADGSLILACKVEDHIPLTPGGKFRLLVQDLPATWWGGYEGGLS